MNTPSIPHDNLDALTWLWRKTLYEDTALRHKFSSHLGLPDHLLQHAAFRTPDSVGIAPAGHNWTKEDGKVYRLNEPRLVYIGAGYYKIRYPFGDSSNLRFWTFDNLRAHGWENYWFPATRL